MDDVFIINFVQFFFSCVDALKVGLSRSLLTLHIVEFLINEVICTLQRTIF